MINPKVSIIVPCFNHEKYILECLNSIIGQTYKNWECIIVNDGSSDSSKKVIEDFLETNQNAKFELINISNNGLSNARNIAVENSSGEYILPLDSDDKIHKKYIEEAIVAFKNNPEIKLVYCKANLFGYKNEYWDLREYDYYALLEENHIFCSAMYRMSEFENGAKYDVDLKYGYEDWDFWLQILDEHSKVYRIDNIYFFYRTKEFSMISFVKDSDKVAYTENHIFCKHYKKYEKVVGEFTSGINLYRILKRNNKFKTRKKNLKKFFGFFVKK